MGVARRFGGIGPSAALKSSLLVMRMEGLDSGYGGSGDEYEGYLTEFADCGVLGWRSAMENFRANLLVAASVASAAVCLDTKPTRSGTAS